MKKSFLILVFALFFGMGCTLAQGYVPTGHDHVVAEYFPDPDDPDSPYVKVYIAEGPAMLERSFSHFRVYRTNCYNEGPYTLENTEVLACELHDTVFIDMSFGNLQPGVYKYGIGCVYAGNRDGELQEPRESEITWSNCIDRDMYLHMTEMAYHFDAPTISHINGYEQIQFPGCMQSANAGDPSLPYQSVSLLLPMGAKAQNIEVELRDFVELNGEYQLYPYQPARPYSKPEATEFVKNEDIYRSSEVYPAVNHGEVSTSYRNGFAFAFSAFSPVRYIPETGKVYYAQTAVVRVMTQSERDDHSSMLWNNQMIVNSVKRMAQNNDNIETYLNRGRAVPGYELLVITPSSYVNAFDEYVKFYEGIGIRTHVVDVESIYASMTGYDNQEKIRNFIIQEYQNNGIIMVNLGGDVDLIPYRGLRCTAYSSSTYTDDIPADLYYCALDGNWDANGNHIWGEIDEEDLCPEIGIARMCFNNNTQLEHILHKTLTYQQSPVLGEFNRIILGGEHLYDNPNTNGSQYLELLIGLHDDNGYTTLGMPEDYDYVRLYEEDFTWSGVALRNAINEGCQYVHHDGHANSSYVAGWYGINNSDFSGANGLDHNYTFFHTSGCDCGAFDEHCILEDMTTISNFAVCVIGNSRYGWFNEGQTEGPSIHLHRETTDAYMNDRIPFIGMAMAEGKCMTAPWVNAPGQHEEGALRWNFYDLNILGDVAVSPWQDEPFNPEVHYTSQLVIGTTSTQVTVSDETGNGLMGFRCSIFYGDEMIAFGMTDENGVAELTFDPAIDVVGDLKLIVTGMNAWPQTFEMSAIPSNTAYVIYYSYSLNDEDGHVDFNETQTLNMSVKNAGNVAANNVVATLTCDKPEYIAITDDTESISTIGGNATIELSNAFTFVVSDDIPNATHVTFNLSCTDGTDVWDSHFTIIVGAPSFEIIPQSSFSVNPGETGNIHFTCVNTGMSLAPNTMFGVYCSAPEISFDQNIFSIGNVEPGQEFSVDFTFSVSENAQVGIGYELILAAYSGQYLTNGSFIFSVGSVTEDWETGDFSKFDWNLNQYTHPWTVVSENPYEGNYCAKSGDINDSQQVELSIVLDVQADGEVSFYKKVSSEHDYDKLKFFIDGNEMGNWSGEVAWSKETFNIPTGRHTLNWTYKKDYAASSGSDCVWIDYISFPPTEVIAITTEVTTDEMVIFPNPNNGSFSINLPEEDCEIVIYNNVGQVVYRQSKANGLTSMNLENLVSGMYFVNVKSVNGNTTVKFVKE